MTFTKPFLILGKVTFDTHVIFWNGIVTKTLMALFQKSKVLKGLISHSVTSFKSLVMSGVGFGF